ncbi:universal stress protein [Achromobacter aloeverae]|uniref:Universal stress protein n=1 Tax=Achromobacter aloeverae TaxID=1750518 RepID=A0A4Q1HN25_9BURK|nr:universal stress protein [Achromobacter aloeverae]RXN92289.1 universal stress protein [Achromobacter aloeverae]
MSCLLVPIDGSESALRALQYVVDHKQMFEPLTLHLLNVPIPINSPHVRRFIDSSTIQHYHQEEGDAALAAARALLDGKGIPYTAHIRAGSSAETIVATADEHHCDQIVMGTRGLGAAAGMWLGSVTTKTLHLAKVPVTVVK